MPSPDERRRSHAGPLDRVPMSLPLPTVIGPRSTIRCVGRPMFKTQAARDMACLLDVDHDVVAWTTLVAPAALDGVAIPADLKVEYPDRRELLVVGDDALPLVDEHIRVAQSHGYVVRAVEPQGLQGHRLENARELLRYAKWTVSLSDRVRLLALLDQEGSLPLADCMSAIRSGRDPIAAIAALCLHRFVEIDLDSGRIGPQTRIAPFRA